MRDDNDNGSGAVPTTAAPAIETIRWGRYRWSLATQLLNADFRSAGLFVLNGILSSLGKRADAVSKVAEPLARRIGARRTLDVLDALPGNPVRRATVQSVIRVADEIGGKAELQSVLAYVMEHRPEALTRSQMMRLARLLSADGKVEAALEMCDRSLASGGDPPAKWYEFKGCLHGELGESDEALKAFAAGVEASAEPPATLLWHYSRILARNGQLGAAAERLAEAIARDGSHPQWRAELEHIRTALEAGQDTLPVERGATWYDTVYAENATYRLDWTVSPYFPVWRKLIDNLSAGAPHRLLEIGCGSGQLARAMSEKGILSEYLGFDYSEEAVRLAQQLAPSLDFEVWNAFEGAIYARGDWQVFLCTEVLEHIEDDLGVLKLLPPGRTFVGTVPDFDSAAHVRFFRSEDEVRHRYGDLLEGFEVETLNMDSGRLFLFSGRTFLEA